MVRNSVTVMVDHNQLEETHCLGCGGKVKQRTKCYLDSDLQVDLTLSCGWIVQINKNDQERHWSFIKLLFIVLTNTMKTPNTTCF